MIDWPLAFSTASQAIGLANELRSIDKEVGHAELKLKTADLTAGKNWESKAIDRSRMAASRVPHFLRAWDKFSKN